MAVMIEQRALRTRFKGAVKKFSQEARFHGVRLLARLQRARCKRTTFIGITGSAGKTTAKELTAFVLSATDACQKSARTSNEPIDVLRTIARTTPDHRYCIVELSAHRPGSLDGPLRALKPDIGVITRVARDHFSAYRSIEAIGHEKGKLISALPENGIAVLNMDDALIKATGESCRRRIIWIGRSAGATLRLVEARSQWPDPLTLRIEHRGQSYRVATKLHGVHTSIAVLAALGVCLAAGLALEHSIAALEGAMPYEGRMEVVESPEGAVFVRDDWKAPHWALASVWDFMRDARASRKIIVLGTISDYSRAASKLYPQVAKEAREVADLVVFVGSHALRGLRARPEPDDRSIRGYPDIRDAAKFLRRELRSGDLVLLKGSNRADHLVRLLLDRRKPVACWRSDCGLLRFCDRCSRLQVAPPAIV